MKHPPRQLGYCTNVHAGADLQATRTNLEQFALEVKRQFQPDRPMGVGLWLAHSAAERLLADNAVGDFAGWLADVGLVPFTLNGFPYGDFHQEVVKHDVYHPTWAEPSRRDYTMRLIEILDEILPEGMEGSISTLPLCWGSPAPSNEELRWSAHHLCEIAESLARLEQETGRLIYLCLEPEPGCVLQRSTDLVNFFQERLFVKDYEAACRRYLRVCHDVCHAAVMFEPQLEVIGRYRSAGIRVGKVQVSSAVCLPLDRLAAKDRDAAIKQLRSFDEHRYLHQTSVRIDGATHFYEDLPLALEAHGGQPAGEWRVHFHVPVYLDRFGLLETSQPDILGCIEAVRADESLVHFEVETYAWGVLPDELKAPDLATGIAREMSWFAEQCVD